MRETEKEIIKELRKNSRKSLSLISKEKNIPLSTVVNNIKRIEKNSIDRHVSILDFSKIGYNFRSYYTIKSNKKEQLLELLLNSECVNTIQKITNKYDYFIECIFQNISESSDFRDSIETHSDSNIVELHFLEELKKEAFIP